MSIPKKLRTAAVAAITLALVATGAATANAAEGDIKNPQGNGSKGSFYLWDGNNTTLADDPTGTRVYDRGESLTISTRNDDAGGEIVPADYVPAGVTTDGVYKFVAQVGNVSGGTNTWDAYEPTVAAGEGGGVYYDNFTIEERSYGDIGKVFTNGGTYYAGLAFTINNGVTVLGTVYRTIHVQAGTGKYTVDPIELEGPVVPVGIVEADLTPALKTLTVTAPEAGSTVIAIDAGAANANKTLKVGAFSDLVDLGQIVLDGAGKGSVDVAGKGFNAGEAHKIFLAESDNTIVAWNTFTLLAAPAGPNSDNTDLSVDVITSNRFEFVAPVNQTVDLGDVKRNKITSPVALGQFSVIDDRDELLGWNLNVSATAFTGPNSATIANTALGYAPVAAGGTQTGVTLGAAKVAGEGAFGVLVSGAANTSTTEGGALFDTNLTFKAPVDAVKGTYNSTLTLDLVSK